MHKALKGALFGGVFLGTLALGGCLISMTSYSWVDIVVGFFLIGAALGVPAALIPWDTI